MESSKSFFLFDDHNRKGPGIVTLKIEDINVTCKDYKRFCDKCLVLVEDDMKNGKPVHFALS